MVRDYGAKRLAFYQDRTRPGRSAPFLVVCLRGRARTRAVAILLSESAGSRVCGERSDKGPVHDCERRRGKLAPLSVYGQNIFASMPDVIDSRRRAISTRLAHRGPSKKLQLNNALVAEPGGASNKSCGFTPNRRAIFKRRSAPKRPAPDSHSRYCSIAIPICSAT